jgi:hypothetical protein
MYPRQSSTTHTERPGDEASVCDWALEMPAESRDDRPATTRRWLLGRGVAAAMLPAIYSIVAPTAVEATARAAVDGDAV